MSILLIACDQKLSVPSQTTNGAETDHCNSKNSAERIGRRAERLVTVRRDWCFKGVAVKGARGGEPGGSGRLPRRSWPPAAVWFVGPALVDRRRARQMSLLCWAYFKRQCCRPVQVREHSRVLPHAKLIYLASYAELDRRDAALPPWIIRRSRVICRSSECPRYRMRMSRRWISEGSCGFRRKTSPVASMPVDTLKMRSTVPAICHGNMAPRKPALACFHPCQSSEWTRSCADSPREPTPTRNLDVFVLE